MAERATVYDVADQRVIALGWLTGVLLRHEEEGGFPIPLRRDETLPVVDPETGAIVAARFVTVSGLEYHVKVEYVGQDLEVGGR